MPENGLALRRAARNAGLPLSRVGPRRTNRAARRGTAPRGERDYSHHHYHCYSESRSELD